MVTLDLYQISPTYRALADELHRLQSELGALRAAYDEALAEQQRAKAGFAAALDAIGEFIARFRGLLCRGSAGT